MSSTIVIFFDLETAGYKESDIVSIGAIAVKRGDGTEVAGGRFQVCILPTTDIDKGASKVNGFTKKDGALFKHGEALEDVTTPQDGLQRFLKFITEQAEGNGGGRIELYAHNAKNFDDPTLRSNFRKFNVDMGNSIRRIYDTVKVAHTYDPSHISYQRAKLNVLMDEYLHPGAGEEQSHDAVGDTEDLLKVLRAMAGKREIPFGELLDMAKCGR